MLHVRNWLRHNERYGAIRGGAPAQRHMSLSLHSRLFDFHISSRRFWAFLYNLVPSMRTNKSCFEWLKAGDYYLHQYIVSLSESHIFEEKICYVHIAIFEILVTKTKQWNIAWVEDCTVWIGPFDNTRRHVFTGFFYTDSPNYCVLQGIICSARACNCA